MIGGFMGVGTPERLVDEIVCQGKRHLTIIANDTAMPGRGIGKLVSAGLVDRVVASHIGLNPETQQKMLKGEMEVELVPQGTVVEDSKQRIEVHGELYLVEVAIKADFALVQAFLADYLGNLSYALTARNFNPVMAMAGETVIACVDNIVPVGVIAPDNVMTPAPLVDFLVTHP